jgi:hypothetical protein
MKKYIALFNLLVGLLLVAPDLQAQVNGASFNAATQPPFCQNTNVFVNFTMAAGSATDNNGISLFLSDLNSPGTFSNAAVTIQASGTPGNIIWPIPANLAPGTYNFRVNSTTPGGSAQTQSFTVLARTFTATYPNPLGPYCGVGSPISIPVSLAPNNCNFATGNDFSLELSDATGNFTTAGYPKTIAFQTSIGGATTLSGNIPSVPTGTGYKLRVRSTNPALTGQESAAFSIDLLTSFTVFGSGTATCASSPTVTLSGSQTGASYQLQRDGANMGNALAGTGSALSFGPQSASGVYSVVAASNTSPPTGCTLAMAQSATVLSNTALPVASLSAVSLSFCTGTSVTLTAQPGANTYAFSGPGLSQSGSTNTAIATQSGTYSVLVTGSNGCTSSAGVSLTINPDPTAVVTFPNGTTVQGTGVAIIRLPPLTNPVLIQASGGGSLPGSSYVLSSVMDRINGYEIRQVDSNTTGVFPINRLGLFTLTVTGAGGCKRTVQWVVQQQ